MFLEQWKALGSIDMENPLEQLEETAMQIVNARDQSDRSALLDCALAQENIDPNIAPVQVRNVCNGPLGWTSIEEPNGISSFLMEIPGIAGNRDSSMTEYVIRLRAQYNVQSSKEDLDAILKKDIIPPRSVEELITILTQQCKLIKIFTHESSVLVVNLENLLEFLNDRMQKIRYKYHIDRTYLLKIQYKIDSKINYLCNDAKRFCKNVSKMNFQNFSNFKYLMNDIDNECLIIDKMPVFLVNIASGVRGQGGSNKRKAFELDTDDDDTCLVTVLNKNKNNAWLLKPGEGFRKVLKNAKGKKPKACMDFWIRGECVSNCPRKKTHVQALTPRQKENMDEFVKSARAQALKAGSPTSSSDN